MKMDKTFSKAYLPKRVLLSPKKATSNKMHIKQGTCCTKGANNGCSVKVALTQRRCFAGKV